MSRCKRGSTYHKFTSLIIDRHLLLHLLLWSILGECCSCGRTNHIVTNSVLQILKKSINILPILGIVKESQGHRLPIQQYQPPHEIFEFTEKG